MLKLMEQSAPYIAAENDSPQAFDVAMDTEILAEPLTIEQQAEQMRILNEHGYSMFPKKRPSAPYNQFKPKIEQSHSDTDSASDIGSDHFYSRNKRKKSNESRVHNRPAMDLMNPFNINDHIKDIDGYSSDDTSNRSALDSFALPSNFLLPHSTQSSEEEESYLSSEQMSHTRNERKSKNIHRSPFIKLRGRDKRSLRHKLEEKSIVPKNDMPRMKSEPKKDKVELSPQNDSEENQPDIWCICRKPHGNRFMICCDRCDEWYHGTCVGITKAKAKQLEKSNTDYVCPFCKDKSKTSLKNEDDDDNVDDDPNPPKNDHFSDSEKNEPSDSPGSNRKRWSSNSRGFPTRHSPRKSSNRAVTHQNCSSSRFSFIKNCLLCILTTLYFFKLQNHVLLRLVLNLRLLQFSAAFAQLRNYLH